MALSYVADFETTTREDDCRVWAWAVCEIGNESNIVTGTDIDSFMDWCENCANNAKVYFHNLRFDSQFLMNWLFNHEYRHVTAKERESGTFTTIISNKGLYYSIEVVFYLKGKNVKKVTFVDSMKLLPMGVDKVAKAFHMDINKLSIDYSAHDDLPPGAPLTPEEDEYIRHDVRIIARALEYFFSQGINRLTIGSCALHEYQGLIGKKNFKRYFPNAAAYHRDIRQSYRGGYVYVNPKYAGKTINKNGIVLDVNSIYPFVQYSKLLPHGTPIFYRGEYKPDPIYPLYVQMIRCSFELRPGKLPTIQLKNSIYYSGNDYLVSSDDKEIALVLTSVDLRLFLEQYDVTNLEYIAGWKFQGINGLFKDYIEKWNGNKVRARTEGNHGLALVSKLFLNSLYGKFGTDTTLRSKIPYMGEDGAVHFKDSEPEQKDGLYIPIASFVTSYARDIIIRAAQKITDDYNAGKSKIDFLYCDTDSLHCLSDDFSLPEGLEIDKTKLGAFKYESKFRRAKYIRSKCYIEDSTEDVENENPDYSLKVTVAGMPPECRAQVNFENFRIGATYKGKKQPKSVKGGVILQEIDFTIKK